MDTLVDSELFFLRFRQCKVHTVYSDDNVDIIYSGSYDRQKSQERKGYACRRQRNSDKRRKEKAKRYIEYSPIKMPSLEEYKREFRSEFEKEIPEKYIACKELTVLVEKNLNKNILDAYYHDL